MDTQIAFPWRDTMAELRQCTMLLTVLPELHTAEHADHAAACGVSEPFRAGYLTY